MDYDVLIIGGGAAGLSGGLVLARSRRKIAVLDAGEPRNEPAGHVHGYLSRDGITPVEFFETGRAEVRRCGGEIVPARVVGAKPADPEGFSISLDDGRELTARGLLVATGLADELPDIPGLRERWGDDVLHCPYCHGYEVRDRPLAVLGGDNRPFTMHQAQLVRQWSADVVFFPNTIEPTDEERRRLEARDVEVVDGPVARLVPGAGGLAGVELADGRVVPREVAFVGPQFLPRDQLLGELGCERGENGWVAVDPSGRTSVPGVWAAGNVVDNPAQLVNAAAEGMTAGIALNHHLLAEDVEAALAAT
ncbi:NAD(P)/FAD-dependent oxidoreductase [Saccharopolyspora griseoalba]|uniref:NAD(P)/FAD-dependent oxidoreductase n=1 Tax=Saccharopolyspora griseoalba TaxID=1431848 RepID=A0ABW2LPE9_9PSEU